LRGRATRATSACHPCGWFARVENDAMTTGDTRAHDEAIVRELQGRGLSIRAIAKQAGFSRPKVDRILARIARPFGSEDTGLRITVDDDDLDDDYAEPEPGPYDDYEPVPPFRFVGLAVAEDRRGNPLKDGNGRPFGPCPRALDGRGVSVGNVELDMWRWCAHARAEGDFDAAEAVEADWARQLAAAGVSCDESGRWVQVPRAV
jgi:hypothetical protein